MMTDLRHIRVFSAFLSKTEIKFDLVSAVDELAAQVRRSRRVLCILRCSAQPGALADGQTAGWPSACLRLLLSQGSAQCGLHAVRDRRSAQA